MIIGSIIIMVLSLTPDFGFEDHVQYKFSPYELFDLCSNLFSLASLFAHSWAYEHNLKLHVSRRKLGYYIIIYIKLNKV